MLKSRYTNKDFVNLKYNVFGVEGDLVTRVKGLGPLVFMVMDRPDRDKLIKYTMALYDRRSPLVREITDVTARKIEAALMSGYDLVADEAVLRPLYDMTDPSLQYLVIEFLKGQSNFYWSMIVSNEQTFYELQKALMEEIVAVSKDKLQSLQYKGKLLDECNTIAERIESYYLKVFGEDELVKTVKTKKYTPESQAKR